MPARVLCVAEKPSIARALAKALSYDSERMRSSPNKYIKNYDMNYNFTQWGPCEVTVTAVMGHITEVDFEGHKNWRSSQEVLFSVPTVTRYSTAGEQVARNIRQEAKRASKLFIWTDCDREGEFIGAEILAEAKKTNSRIEVHRAIFNNAVDSHLREAADRPAQLDMNQAAAVRVRRDLDLRTGAAFTRMQTVLFQQFNKEKTGPISYGACQFPTLGFVVDRYLRIKNHIPEDFFYIDLKLSKEHKGAPSEVEFKWDRNRLFDKLSTVVLYEKALTGGDNARVLSVSDQPTSQYKPFPLTTVVMQKSGARFLNLTGKKIMEIAEDLYNKGFISYPRTETDSFDSAIDLHALVAKQQSNPDLGNYAKELLNGKFSQPRKGKHNDKSHPPIHPVVGANRNSSVLQGDHYRVFEFICRHFLACCSDDAKGRKTTIKVQYGEEKFHTTGVRVVERNYLDVYIYAGWASKELPQFQQGEQVPVAQCKLQQGKTSAPNLLTEPDLIGLMEANGIGTDATIAEHIQKIQDRHFVKKNRKKEFDPLPLGVALVKGYDRIGLDKSLSKPDLRRETEQLVSQIASGAVAERVAQDRIIQEYQARFRMSDAKKTELITAARELNALGVQ